MNIWLVNHYAIPPDRAGGTRHHNLGKQLVALGHDVSIVACAFDHMQRSDDEGRPPTELIDGVRFRWVKAPGYSGNTLARFFNMVVFALRVWSGRSTRDLPEPDVVIGSSPHLFGADAAARLAKRRRVPFVLEIRDLWPLTLVDVGGFSTRHPAVVLMSWLERRLY
ncbi:MAG: glycosyltransferase, partial [Acidimicrobiia bacterium]|nr:glycosyltransferase [Acidimicrobiia bacterium]